MVFDQTRIEEVIIEHFKGIFNGQEAPLVNDPNEFVLNEESAEVYSSSINIKENEFEDEICTPYTTKELDEILDTLPSGKASSTDHIPNELLKHTTPTSRIYLQLLLNKIVEDGQVPEALNQGKCVLIYKVHIIINTY